MPSKPAATRASAASARASSSRTVVAADPLRGNSQTACETARPTTAPVADRKLTTRSPWAGLALIRKRSQPSATAPEPTTRPASATVARTAVAGAAARTPPKNASKLPGSATRAGAGTCTCRVSRSAGALAASRAGLRERGRRRALHARTRRRASAIERLGQPDLGLRVAAESARQRDTGRTCGPGRRERILEVPRRVVLRLDRKLMRRYVRRTPHPWPSAARASWPRGGGNRPRERPEGRRGGTPRVQRPGLAYAPGTAAGSSWTSAAGTKATTSTAASTAQMAR